MRTETNNDKQEVITREIKESGLSNVIGRLTQGGR